MTKVTNSVMKSKSKVNEAFTVFSKFLLPLSFESSDEERQGGVVRLPKIRGLSSAIEIS